LIIGSDTVVYKDGVIFEKPTDKEDAIRILRELNGKSHSVFTGVVILKHDKSSCQKYSETSFHESTQVKFAENSMDVLRAYVETGEPMDKAGAYGVQGQGGALVEKIDGCYYNVEGFPYFRFTQELLKMYK